MKQIFITGIIFISAICLNAADLRAYRDTPLLSARVQDNRLPYGEYSLLRAYKNVTQLVTCVNNKIILYTDRENQKNSEIFTSAYSLVDDVILEAPAMAQHEFNLAVERLIRKGDSSSDSTIPFPGCEKFIEEIKKGLIPEKNDGEYFIYLKEKNRAVSLMSINLLWKKLTLRNMQNEKGVPSTFYSIYIDECYDKNIKNIIREYSAVIKK